MKQAQNSGSRSNNLQVNNLVVNNAGLSYADARLIALDVFRSELNTLAGQAAQTAWERVESITDKFLLELQKQNPNGFSKANDPGFQYALHALQTEYVKTGDDDLGDVLVGLLVDHTKQERRSLIQIVLAECLTTVPKLTPDQINSLALLFYFRNVKGLSIDSLSDLAGNIDRYIRPFVSSYAQSDVSFQYMQFCGCGASTPLVGIALESILLQKYPGLLTNGFDRAHIDGLGLSVSCDHPLFIKCLNNPSNLQVRAIDLGVLEQRFTEYALPSHEHEKIKELMNLNMLTPEEVNGKMSELLSYWSSLSVNWNKGGFKAFDLTSVGMAIGHASIKRNSQKMADLNIWIK